MKVGELKQYIKNIPDNFEIRIGFYNPGFDNVFITNNDDEIKVETNNSAKEFQISVESDGLI